MTWQDHEDWTAASVGEMNSSDAESIRVAGRYIMDMGDGMSVQISAMYEDLEYEFNGVTTVDKAMAAFGYGNFGCNDEDECGYALQAAGEVITGTAGMDAGDPTPAVLKDFNAVENKDSLIKSKKTLDRIHTLFAGIPKGNHDSDDQTADLRFINLSDAYVDDKGTPDDTSDDETILAAGDYELPDIVSPMNDEQYTVENEMDDGTGSVSVNDYDEDYTIVGADHDDFDRKKDVAAKIRNFLLAVQSQENPGEDDEMGYKYEDAYAELVRIATEEAEGAFNMDPANIITAEIPGAAAVDPVSATAARAVAMGNVKIEREAWMVSGKIKFGGPVDFRFSYMDADDLEVSCANCTGDWDETAADAWNVGLFYTMPAGTELRLTYSEVDNDKNGTYGQGISGTGLGTAGSEVEMFAVGIVHWFD